MNKIVVLVARLLLGIMLIGFGLNVFLQFMTGGSFGEAGDAFLGALLATGYVMPVMGLVMLLVGAMLVSNYFVPLSLVILAPLVLNWTLFHIFLHLESIPFLLPIALLYLFLVYINWPAYKTLLTPKQA